MMEYSNSLIDELEVQDINEILKISQQLIQISDSQSIIVAKLLNRISYGCTYDDAKKVMRFLSDHIIPDSSLTQIILESLYTTEFPNLIIEYMSQLIPVDQEEDLSLVLECYKDLIESNESLMIPIIGSISEFKLSNKLKIMAFEITESCLPVVSEADVPIVVRTLLLSLTKEVAKSAINTIRYETSRILPSNFTIVLEVISNVIKINVVAVRYFFDAIERSDRLLKLDIYLLLILLNSSKTKESNKAKKLLLQSIQSHAIDLKLLKSIFEEDNEGTFLEQSSLLKLCNHFLLSNNNSLIDFTYELYILLFINYPKMRIEILNNLFSISYNSFRTLNVSMKDITDIKDDSNAKLTDEVLQRRRYQTTTSVLVSLCEKYTKLVVQHAQLFEDVLTQWSHSIFLNLDTLDPIESKIQLLFVTHNLCRCLVNIAKYQPRILSSLMIYVQKQTASGSMDAQISGLIVASHILNHLEPSEVPLLLNFLMRIFKNRCMMTKLYLLDLFCGETSHHLPDEIINNFFFEFILNLLSQIPIFYNHDEIGVWQIKTGKKAIPIVENVEYDVLYSIGSDRRTIYDVISLANVFYNNGLIIPNILPKLLESFIIFKPKLSDNNHLSHVKELLKAGFRLPKDFRLYENSNIDINENFIIIFWYHFIIYSLSLALCNYYVSNVENEIQHLNQLFIEKYILTITSLQSLTNLIEYGKQHIKEDDPMNQTLSFLISHYQNRPKLYPQTVLCFIKNISDSIHQNILIKSFEILYDNLNQFLVLKNSIYNSKSMFQIKNTIGNRSNHEYPLDFIFVSNFEAMNQTTLYMREFNSFEDDLYENGKNLSLLYHLLNNQTLQTIIELCTKFSKSINELKKMASELITQGKDDEAEDKRKERDQNKVVLIYCYLIFGHIICYLKLYPHHFEKIMSRLYFDENVKNDPFRYTMEKLFVTLEKQWIDCEDVYLIIPLLNILYDLTDGTKKVKEVSNFMVLSLKRLYPSNLQSLSKYIPSTILNRFSSPLHTMHTPGIDPLIRYLIRGAYLKMSHSQKLSFVDSLIQALSEINTFIDEEYEHPIWQMLSNKTIFSFCLAIMQLIFDSISQYDVMKLKSPKDDPFLYLYQSIQQFHDVMLIFIYVYCNCKDSVNTHNIDLGFLLKSCSKLLSVLRKKLISCIEWRSSYSLTNQRMRDFNTSLEILKYPFSNTLLLAYTLRSLISQIKFPKDRQISRNLSSNIRDLKSIPQLTLEVEQTIDFILMSKQRHHIPIDQNNNEANMKSQLLNVLTGKSMDIDESDHDILETPVVNEYIHTLPSIEKKIRNRISVNSDNEINSSDWELLEDSELEEDDLELFFSYEESETHSLDDIYDIDPDASDFLIEDREDD